MPCSRTFSRLVAVAVLTLLSSGCASTDQPGPVTTSTSVAVVTATPTASATSIVTEASATSMATRASATPAPTTLAGTSTIIGGERPVKVFEPEGYQHGTPAPLLLLLHGYGGDAAGIEAYFKLKPVAEQAGLLYAVPEGLRDSAGRRFWNAGPVCCDFNGVGVDDSAYLRQVIEEIQTRYSVDPRRIFIVGFSNGGFMAHRMACDHADLVTGIVSMAGTGLLDPAACTASQPVVVLQIHGEADGSVLYEGAMSSARYPGAIRTVEDWAERNGCATTARQGPALDLVADRKRNQPGQSVQAEAETTAAIYDSGCKPGGHGELWTMAGAPHHPELAPTFGQQVVSFLLAHARAD